MGAIQNSVNQTLVLGGVATKVANNSAKEKFEIAEKGFDLAKEVENYEAKKAGIFSDDLEKIDSALAIDIRNKAIRSGIIGLKKATNEYYRATDEVNKETKKLMDANRRAMSVKQTKAIQKIMTLEDMRKESVANYMKLIKEDK